MFVTVFGWDIRQWARVLAIYKDEPVTSLDDALLIRKKYTSRNIGDPCAKSCLVGVEPPMDFTRASKVIEMGIKVSNLPPFR
jgi:hypothetical protein